MRPRIVASAIAGRLRRDAEMAVGSLGGHIEPLQQGAVFDPGASDS